MVGLPDANSQYQDSYYQRMMQRALGMQQLQELLEQLRDQMDRLNQQIREILRQETGLPVTVDDDPLTTVARGAGQALEELERLEPGTRRHPSARRNR